MGILQTGVDLLRGKKHLMLKPSHKVMSASEPVIYNKDGQRLKVIYLKDKYWGPYGCYAESSRLFFDRYNYGLPTHLYSCKDMLSTDGKPVAKYGMLNESEKIIPQDYQIFDKHKGLAKEFVKIFTWSERLLNQLDNAEIFPALGSFVQNDNPELYAHKNKLVSMVCSKKVLTDCHRLRVSIARQLKAEGLADVFGNLDGGARFASKDITLDDYYFQVVVENDVSAYYFSEKILDCFVKMVIPVYIGATKISTFFNPDGIIEIKPEDYGRIDEIVKKLDVKYYEERLDAVKDNYERVQAYLNGNDYLYKHL